MSLPSLHCNSKRTYVPVWDLHNDGSLESWNNGLALCRSHMDTYKFQAAMEGRQRSPESSIHDGRAHCSYIVSSVCTSPLCRQNTVPGRRRCVRSTGTLGRYFWVHTGSYWATSSLVLNAQTHLRKSLKSVGFIATLDCAKSVKLTIRYFQEIPRIFTERLLAIPF